jgi:enoyl-CoA hydratase
VAVTTSPPRVLVTRPAEGVALVTLNRPEARNAVDDRMARALGDTVAALEADEAISAVVLTGAGPAFCAGADMKAAAAGRPREFFATPEGGFAGFAFAARQKPWIAAVKGAAFGGGFEIVLACDLLVAGEGARFALPEVRRGLIASAGGVFRTPRRLPPAIAFEMIATGAPLDAARAHQLGLANRLVPDEVVVEAALTLASAIAANAPLALRESLTIARLAAGTAEEADLLRLAGEASDRVRAAGLNSELLLSFGSGERDPERR